MDHESLILGELREFKARALERLHILEKKTDSFQAFRFKLIGASMLASMLVAGLFEAIRGMH